MQNKAKGSALNKAKSKGVSLLIFDKNNLQLVRPNLVATLIGHAPFSQTLITPAYLQPLS